jgi:hypothetical protein
VAGIRKEVEQANRARLGTNPEGLTHDQLLERYLVTKGTSTAQREQLHKIAEEIFENTPTE